MTSALTVPPGARVALGGRRRRGPGLAAKLLPLLPAVVLLLLFFAGPVVWSVYTAFTNQSLSGAGASDAQFIGLSNFSRMVSDPDFWHSIVLTVVFVVGSAVIGQNTLGLLIALLLRHRRPFTPAGGPPPRARAPGVPRSRAGVLRVPVPHPP